MTWIGSFYRSALGKKAVMAVTGIFIFGWVFGHMIGNAKMYLGAEHFNEYAKWLRTMGAPALPQIFGSSAGLWIVRVLFIVAIWFHVQSATLLTLMNWGARPVAYRDRDYVTADYASRTMRWGGVIIALFILYHLAHFTWGWHVAPVPFAKDDPYRNVVAGFQVWWVSGIYVVANLALGLHLFHGLSAMFSSLGLSHERFNPWKRYFATAFAVIVAGVNVSFPIAVLMGIVR